MRENKINYDYADGSSVEIDSETGEIIIETKNEYCTFKENVKYPEFLNQETGEKVVEYSGLKADNRQDRSLAKAIFNSKGSSPLHYHNIGTEDYYIIQGTAMVIVDGKEHKLPVGEWLRIQSGQKHQVFNLSEKETVELIVICTPAWDIKDYHLLPDVQKQKSSDENTHIVVPTLTKQ